MRIERFDYQLPAGCVAQEPSIRRDASRLLLLPRRGQLDYQFRRFDELADHLEAGDLLVVNDARVVPARLWARRASGGLVELLLVRPAAAASFVADGEPGPRWEAMVRPSRRLAVGERLAILPGGKDEPARPAANEPKATSPGRHDLALQVDVVGELAGGRRLLAFPPASDVPALLESHGVMPLPPYIERSRGDRRQELDRQRYQTIYARVPGAIAAPTAGLHFTRRSRQRLAAAGVGWASLTLHVGPGTFQPLRCEHVEEHVMEPERYVIPQRTVDAIAEARTGGGRIVAVGTTVVRALEHAVRRHGRLEAGEGRADLYITPGFRFRLVDAMVTNFHLPRSTPILLGAALAGRERLLAAYRAAIEAGFRFYSYGDAMLVR
ncbi:MAG: tRNA preQ1(34) S-adenosylmethionine ribosyltransferase-isomerase QueA [Acidobacteriota bacterium]